MNLALNAGELMEPGEEVVYSPRTQLDKRQRGWSRLILTMIMTLGDRQLHALKESWKAHENGCVSLPEFIELMLEHIDPHRLQSNKEEFVPALIEFFRSLKPDDTKLLSFDTFFGSAVHMGMRAANQLVSEHFKPYRTGLKMRSTKLHIEQQVSYIEELKMVMIAEPTTNLIRLFRPDTMEMAWKFNHDKGAILSSCYLEKNFAGDDLDVLMGATPQTIYLWEGIASFQGCMVCDEIYLPSVCTVLLWVPEKSRVYGGTLQGKIFSWKIVKVSNRNARNFRSRHSPRPRSAIPMGNHPKFAQKMQSRQRDTVEGTSYGTYTRNFRFTSKNPSRNRRGNRKPKTVHAADQRSSATGKGHTDAVVCMEHLASMDILYTGSLDTTIRLWNLDTLVEQTVFVGHRAGVVDLSYSDSFRYLVSASIDHDVGVWHPLNGTLVTWLKGHEAPLLKAKFVNGGPQIVTADQEGVVKVWDARHFGCVQTLRFGSDITGMSPTGEFGRIVCAGRNGVVQCYDQEGGPVLGPGEEAPVFCTLYNRTMTCMLTCSRTDVKIWNALTGKLGASYRGLSRADLSAACMDATERNIIVGNRNGKINMYNLLTGSHVASFQEHDEEITFLYHLKYEKKLVSAGRDQVVRVHDLNTGAGKRPVVILRCPSDTEIMVATYGEQSHSIACAATDGNIYTWNIDVAGNSDDFRKVIRRSPEHRRGTALSMIFLHAYPILAVGDESGAIGLWYSNASEYTSAPAAVIDTRARCGITCLDFDHEKGILYSGDSRGCLCTWDLKSVFLDGLTESDSKHAIVQSSNFSASAGGVSMSLSGNKLDKIDPKSNPTANLQPMFSIQTSFSGLSSIVVMEDPSAIITVARETQVHLWSKNGIRLGTLDAAASAAEFREQLKKQRDDSFLAELEKQSLLAKKSTVFNSMKNFGLVLNAFMSPFESNARKRNKKKSQASQGSQPATSREALALSGGLTSARDHHAMRSSREANSLSPLDSATGRARKMPHDAADALLTTAREVSEDKDKKDPAFDESQGKDTTEGWKLPLNAAVRGEGMDDLAVDVLNLLGEDAAQIKHAKEAFFRKRGMLYRIPSSKTRLEPISDADPGKHIKMKKLSERKVRRPQQPLDGERAGIAESDRNAGGKRQSLSNVSDEREILLGQLSQKTLSKPLSRQSSLPLLPSSDQKIVTKSKIKPKRAVMLKNVPSRLLDWLEKDKDMNPRTAVDASKLTQSQADAFSRLNASLSKMGF